MISPGAPLNPLEPQHPHGRARATDSVRVLFGLAVIWASLFIVFRAHELSDAHISLDRAGLEDVGSPNGHLNLLDPRARLLDTVSMDVRDLSRRTALIGLLERADLTIEREPFESLSGEEGAFRFDREPLYRVAHKLIADTSRGLALYGAEARLIQQDLTIHQDGNELHSVEWRADLPLDAPRVSIFPGAGLDLWFSLELAGRDDHQQAQLEVWRGSQWVGMIRAPMRPHARGTMVLNDSQRLAFSLEPTSEMTSDGKRIYAMEFLFQIEAPKTDDPDAGNKEN